MGTLLDRLFDLCVHWWSRRVARRRLRAIESRLHDLFDEMRSDLQNHPGCRQFIVKARGWVFNSGGEPFFEYMYEDHNDLQVKIDYLIRKGLVTKTRPKSTPIYYLTDTLVRYLDPTNKFV